MILTIEEAGKSLWEIAQQTKAYEAPVEYFIHQAQWVWRHVEGGAITRELITHEACYPLLLKWQANHPNGKNWDLTPEAWEKAIRIVTDIKHPMFDNGLALKTLQDIRDTCLHE